MNKGVWLIIGCFLSFKTMAEKPAGFLWYNLVPEHKQTRPIQGTSFNRLSFTEQDAVLRFYTMEALHKARHTKSIQDMRIFLSLQDYWLRESSTFGQLFQQTLMIYPQYDYTVMHPTSSLGAQLLEEQRQLKRKRIITTLAKSHGLLFFYRGKNPYDQQQIPIVRHFCQRFNLPLMPVSIDGQLTSLLPQSRLDKGQASRLGLRFFPALLLANPKTRKVLPVAFGLTTQDVLEQRLVQIARFASGESS